MTMHLNGDSLDDALVKGKDAFFDWTVRLHNAVNKGCGKTTYDPQVARLLYDKGYGCGRGLVLWRWLTTALIVAAVLGFLGRTLFNPLKGVDTP
jgi:hypothetical protein